MASKDNKLKGLNVPWITKEGYLDLARFPIDSTLVQAMSKDDETFRNGCRSLGAMISAERTEAAVFLYGLMDLYAADISRKAVVVEALGSAKCVETANILFRELTQIESSNTTRGYIKTILECLTRFPLDLVRGGFEKQLQDKKWSYRMKRKFNDIIGIDPPYDWYSDDDEW